MTTLLSKFKLTLFLVSLMSIANAADRFWVATSTSNWNNTANWSTTSGGSGGASVPTSGDRCYFYSNKNGSCNIDANVNVYGMSIAGYLQNADILSHQERIKVIQAKRTILSHQKRVKVSHP